jgi:hypothetical protein
MDRLSRIAYPATMTVGRRPTRIPKAKNPNGLRPDPLTCAHCSKPALYKDWRFGSLEAIGLCRDHKDKFVGATGYKLTR